MQKQLLGMILSHGTELAHPLLSAVRDQFELCLAKCRTSSQVRRACGVWPREQLVYDSVVRLLVEKISVLV